MCLDWVCHGKGEVSIVGIEFGTQGTVEEAPTRPLESDSPWGTACLVQLFLLSVGQVRKLICICKIPVYRDLSHMLPKLGERRGGGIKCQCTITWGQEAMWHVTPCLINTFGAFGNFLGSGVSYSRHSHMFPSAHIICPSPHQIIIIIILWAATVNLTSQVTISNI